MYWSWESKGRPTPPIKPAEKKLDEAERPDGLLDAVIEKSAKKPRRRRRGKRVYAMFPTPAFESRFKTCLSRVPLDCHVEREGRKQIMALRPKNIRMFDELIRSSGLANCDAAVRVVRWLQANPSEYLRFEID